MNNINKFYRPGTCKECSTSFQNLTNHIRYKHNILPEDYYKKYIEELSAGVEIKNKNSCCLTCGKPTKFLSFFEGYQKYCCPFCSGADKELNKARTKTLDEANKNRTPEKQKEINEKTKETKKQRYGTENYTNNKKIVETCLKRYGTENYTQTKEYKEKVKETSLKKYGVEHFTQQEEIKNKIKETNLKKYGKTTILAVEEERKKFCEIKRQKYGGLISPLQRETFNKNILAKKKEATRKLKETEYEHIKVLDFDEQNSKYRFECKKCKKIIETNGACYNPRAKTFPRCEECFPKLNTRNSLFQQEFEGFLEGYKIAYERNNRTILKELGLEIDIYVPEQKIGIELNGLFYHSEVNGEKPRKYHLSKTKKAEEKGIRLLHIFSDEWQEKKEVVKSMVLHKLGKNNKQKIHARKCKIKTISPQEKTRFLQENHIQGADYSNTIPFGAFYQNELVSVMTFSRGKRKIFGGLEYQKDHVELVRFAIKKYTLITGIASKLFQAAIKELKPEKIISFADRRWSSDIESGILYMKLGFKKDTCTSPNYWYLLKKNSYKKRVHRFAFRKSLLNKKLDVFDKEKSEWENMKQNGNDRVWDCGTIKYVWCNNNEK